MPKSLFATGAGGGAETRKPPAKKTPAPATKKKPK
jgi:hypothetical protein